MIDKDDFSSMSRFEREWLLYQQNHFILERLERMANTLDDLKAAIQQEETVEASLITLVQNLGTQIKNTVQGLTADQQAEIDSLLASVTADSAAMSAAVTANTPAAPTAG